jgi:hypothetical protein
MSPEQIRLVDYLNHVREAIPRCEDRHILSMRKANGREKRRIAPLLEV